MPEAARFAALTDNRLIRRLVKIVAELDLDRRDFVIFGSGPLLAHGLRRHIRDLDVVARGAVWRRVSQLGFPATGSINGAPMAVFWGGLIQFSRGWISEDWDTDGLIDRAEIIQGLPFAQLADVLDYKQMLGRPKDRLDVKTLVQSLRQMERCPAADLPIGLGEPYAVVRDDLTDATWRMVRSGQRAGRERPTEPVPSVLRDGQVR